MDAILQTVFNAPATPSIVSMTPSAVNDTVIASTSFNATGTDSLQDFVFAFALSFAPFLKDLPDWLKLAILGGVFETSRRYLSSWYYAIKSAMFITVVFDSNDTSFQWMMAWISRQPGFNRARQMEVSTRYSSGESGSAIFSEEDEKIDDDDKNLKYIPTPAVSYKMWYKNRWMEITRTKSGGQGYYDEETDRMTLRILTRNRKLVSSLLREAKRAYTKQAEQAICVYVNDQSDNWRHVACRAKRPLRSIILDPGVVDLLLEDARDFLDSKQWYADRGIPHRRGYLLYGKPGSGKTSLIQAIAGELGLHVYIISLSRVGLDDTTLSSAIGDLPSRCIALMEDIDAAFTRGISRGKDEESSGGDEGEGSSAGPKPAGPKEAPASRVTLSGLLNALDGVGAQEGRILFATTNRYQTLDSALIRPGRLDLHIEFKYASQFQIEELFRTFYQPLRGAKEDLEKQDEKDKDKKGDLNEKESTAANLDVPLVGLGPAAVTTEKVVVAPPTPSNSGSVSPDASPVAAPTADIHVTSTTDEPSSKSGLAFGTSHSARAPAFSVAQYDALAKQFAAQVPADTFSMAALQGYLMTYKIRPVQAVKDVAAWVEKEQKEQRGASTGTTVTQMKESEEKSSES